MPLAVPRVDRPHPDLRRGLLRQRGARDRPGSRRRPAPRTRTRRSATDPNSEHPQLAKLIIAGGIELFGDGPFAWRLPSVLLGTVAILGMFALVRAAGGGRWTALGAAALMAADNLLLVHSRIGTLDIYATAAMIWAAALYLRGRPVLAGVVIGVGACAKEVTPYVLFALVVLEVLRWIRLGAAGAVDAVAAAGGVRGRVRGRVPRAARRARPDRASRTTRRRASSCRTGPFGEIWRMLSYAANQTSPHGPQGIASYPWDWLVDIKPITYLQINPAHPTAAAEPDRAGGPLPRHDQPADPAARAARRWCSRRCGVTGRRFGGSRDEVGLVGLAWFIGTYAAVRAASLFESRTSYLYYMVIVMPGIYVAVADLIGRIGPGRPLCIAWMVSVLAAVVVMYPFTPLP